MVIQEQYTPQVMTANTSFVTTNQKIGGFICTVSGTLNITKGNGSTILVNFPVTAGVYYPLPLYVGNYGATITLSGGAAGSLLV